ncbi:MAG: dual specificity protein phosphatase family protein [Bdellovibrionales bacterium]|nr:dual specificity protein phosphatase family protein [Bdellovibrionales bacterium]
MTRFARLRPLIVTSALLASFSAFALPPAFKSVTPNIYRGGRPTVGDLRQLARMGVGLIVNLENVPDVVRAEAREANSLGIRELNIPLDASVEPKDAEIDRAVRELRSTGTGKVYVHCQRGQDRTGVVVAFYRMQVGRWTPKRAYREMMDSGFSRKYAKPLEDYFRARTGYQGNFVPFEAAVWKD